MRHVVRIKPPPFAPRELLARLRPAERQALASRPAFLSWLLEMVAEQGGIPRDDPRLLNALDRAVEAGLITAQRRDEILNG